MGLARKWDTINWAMLDETSARSQMGKRTAGAMHKDGAVLGASQENKRGRISIALTGRFRAAITPLIDFSDSDYKVGAFRASSVKTTETKWWAGACAWANPTRILNVGSCAIKKNLWPSPCDPIQVQRLLQLERRRGDFSVLVLTLTL
jgi:hypothetical protein